MRRALKLAGVVVLVLVLALAGGAAACKYTDLDCGIAGSQTAAGNTDLPDGFRQDVIASGLNAPTDLAFLPDGNLLVSEKAGVVKLIDTRNRVRREPYLDIQDRVNTAYLRGLLSIQVDPDFERQRLPLRALRARGGGEEARGAAHHAPEPVQGRGRHRARRTARRRSSAPTAWARAGICRRAPTASRRTTPTTAATSSSGPTAPCSSPPATAAAPTSSRCRPSTRRTSTRWAASSCTSRATGAACATTRSGTATPARTAPGSGPTGCATPGGSRSTPRPASPTWATWAGATSRRSTP